MPFRFQSEKLPASAATRTFCWTEEVHPAKLGGKKIISLTMGRI